MPAAAVQYLQQLAGTGSDTMCGWAAEVCCSLLPQLPQVHRRHHHVERQKNLVRALLAVGCTRRMSRGLLQSCWIPFFNVGGAHAAACGGTVR